MRRSAAAPVRAHTSRNAIVATIAMALLGAACSPATGQQPSAGQPSGTPAGFPSPAASLPPTAGPATATPTTPPVALFGALPGALKDSAVAARLQAALDAAIARGAPDIMAAVISPAGTWAGAAGVGGLDAHKATAEDEYYLGGITQIFTAALTMRLAEQGKIDLDAPLASYLGDIDVNTNGATVARRSACFRAFPVRVRTRSRPSGSSPVARGRCRT